MTPGPSGRAAPGTPVRTAPGASERTAPATTSIAARISQVVAAIVVAVVSVLLLVTMHRLQLTIAGVDLPVGLVFGAVFQFAASTFLWAATGARLPVVVLGCIWGLMVLPFAGTSPGGGVLMPAVIAQKAQISGWIVQGIGIVVPFVFLGIQHLASRPTRPTGGSGSASSVGRRA
ncbi:hypothetical protein [Brachybacterium subflavum]|uniref:hypothetical protein n=1 Tax=Brachybacterium subflavum TaxID=2585206 RepID=UPI0018793B4E|nr:hypothetical protein [Brachybacterium subflavum]